MQELAPGVYAESGYYGVVVGAILAGDDLICVDSPTLPADARDWQSRLVSLTRRPIRYVLYTDVHRDRILSSQYLDGTVVTHQAAGEALKGYGDLFRQQAADFLSRRAPEAAAELAANWRAPVPHITLSARLDLYYEAMSIGVQHVGGATPSSVWVSLPKQGVLFAGDVVTVNTHPYLAEADLERWLDLLSGLGGKKPPAAIIVPGRGGAVCRKKDIKELADYIEAVRARVRALVRSHRPRSDVAGLALEFLPRFPIPDAERDQVQRRVRAGLEHVYDLYSSRS